MPGLLVIGLYALPIWFFSSHKEGLEYTGYPLWYGVSLVAALAIVWNVPVRESRFFETMAILSLAGLQAVLVFLLENWVGHRDHSRVWLLLALPATVWMSLALMVNRTSRWLTQGTEGEASRLAYEQRMRMLAVMGMTWFISAALVAFAVSILPFIRSIFDDYMLFFLWVFSTGGFGFWMTALVERKMNPSPSPVGVEIIKGKGVPEAIAIEVQTELDRLSRFQMDCMLAAGALGLLLSWAVFLVFGHSADGFALGAFFVSQVIMIVLVFAAGPWYKRRWHKEILSNRFGVELYRVAAERTPLEFSGEII